MLSKAHTLILGIIAENPVNPYEITKLLDRIRVKDWFPMVDSSVYATIKALHKKKYIVGKTKKEGNMPEKTVYSATAEGVKALHEAITEYLTSMEFDMHKFNISVMFICHLQKEEALELLKNKLIKLKKTSIGMLKQIEAMEFDDYIPKIALTTVKYNRYLSEAETKAIKELIAEIEKDNSWNHFIARDLK